MPKAKQSKSHPCTHPGCFKTLGRASDLNRHLRTHEPVKQFHCAVPGCDFGANQLGGLDVHMNTHTGAKPYVCILCNLGFGDRSSLLRHVKNQVCSRDKKKSRKKNIANSEASFIPATIIPIQSSSSSSTASTSSNAVPTAFWIEDGPSNPSTLPAEFFFQGPQVVESTLSLPSANPPGSFPQGFPGWSYTFEPMPPFALSGPPFVPSFSNPIPPCVDEGFQRGPYEEYRDIQQVDLNGTEGVQGNATGIFQYDAQFF